MACSRPTKLVRAARQVVVDLAAHAVDGWQPPACRHLETFGLILRERKCLNQRAERRSLRMLQAPLEVIDGALAEVRSLSQLCLRQTFGPPMPTQRFRED